MRAKAADGSRTFTEMARRAQIVECAIDAVAELGYAGATMAEIARRAAIAKSVISYHFADKDELITEVVASSFAAFAEFMAPRFAAEPTATGKVRVYIEGSADFMLVHRNVHVAVVDILINARAADGRPLLATMSFDADEAQLEGILRQGQSAGEFGDFDSHVAAATLRSAVTQSMVSEFRTYPNTDLLAYARELTILFDRALRK